MKELNSDIINARLKNNSTKFRQLGVAKIGLFGSYLHGFQHPDSDIDILVEFSDGQNNFDNFMDLCFLLDDIFRGKKVDVVTINSLSPYIGPKILQSVQYVALSA